MVIILAAVGFLLLIMTAVILVSIAWTHRPDLSAFDILREAMKEIKNTIAGKNRQAEYSPQQKGKTE